MVLRSSTVGTLLGRTIDRKWGQKESLTAPQLENHYSTLYSSTRSCTYYSGTVALNSVRIPPARGKLNKLTAVQGRGCGRT